jgi:hypothetical protein
LPALVAAGVAFDVVFILKTLKNNFNFCGYDPTVSASLPHYPAIINGITQHKTQDQIQRSQKFLIVKERELINQLGSVSSFAPSDCHFTRFFDAV